MFLCVHTDVVSFDGTGVGVKEGASVVGVSEGLVVLELCGVGSGVDVAYTFIVEIKCMTSVDLSTYIGRIACRIQCGRHG